MSDIQINIPANGLVGDMSAKSSSAAASSSFDWSSALKNSTASLSPAALWILVRTETRPWSEFVRLANFTKPIADGANLVEVQRSLADRLLTNGWHFRYNYALVSFVLMLYSLLTAPLLLIVVLASGYGQLRIRNNSASATTSTVSVFGRPLTTAHQHVALAALTAPVLYLLGAGGLLFWVLGATAFVGGVHAICYDVAAVRRLQSGERDDFGFVENV